MKKLICCLLTGLGIVSLLGVSSTSKSTFAEEPEYVYYTNFEGMTINASNPPDGPTGFVWAQEYKQCKTEPHNGSTMLYVTAANATEGEKWSAIGGLGIGSKSNLGKCKQGESYQVDMYFEFQGMDFLEVEFCGGSDKWGACRIYGEDDVRNDNGGNNMTDIYYRNNHLSFKYTYSYNSDAGQNGWIQFKGYNANNVKAWMDNISIIRSRYQIDGTFEEYALGGFDGTDAFGKKTIFYTQTNALTSRSTIINDDGNKKLKIDFDNDTAEGKAAFYFNKLQFMNRAREYTFTFDIETTDINKMYFVYGGGWISPKSQVIFDVSNKTVEKEGTVITEASYNNGKMSIVFTAPNTESGYGADWAQFEVVCEANPSTTPTIILDNTKFEMTPIIDYLFVDDTNAKTNFKFGEAFSYEGIKVYAYFTDGLFEEIEPSKCTFTGYDASKQGKQTITVTYAGVEDYYQVIVARIPTSLTLETINVKKSYGYGEALDLTNLVVKVNYEDGLASDTLENGAIKGGYSIDQGLFNPYINGVYVITIYYKEIYASFAVEVTFDVTVDFTDINFGEVGNK